MSTTEEPKFIEFVSYQVCLNVTLTRDEWYAMYLCALDHYDASTKSTANLLKNLASQAEQDGSGLASYMYEAHNSRQWQSIIKGTEMADPASRAYRDWPKSVDPVSLLMKLMRILHTVSDEVKLANDWRKDKEAGTHVLLCNLSPDSLPRYFMEMVADNIPQVTPHLKWAKPFANLQEARTYKIENGLADFREIHFPK